MPKTVNEELVEVELFDTKVLKEEERKEMPAKIYLDKF